MVQKTLDFAFASCANIAQAVNAGDITATEVVETALTRIKKTNPVLNAYIARAGMELISGIGMRQIRAWHEVLLRRLIEGGRDRGLTLHGVNDVARKTVSTAFQVENAHAVEAAMRARGVLPAARGSVVRLAPHFYTSLDDIDTALDMLAEVVRGR